MHFHKQEVLRYFVLKLHVYTRGGIIVITSCIHFEHMYDKFINIKYNVIERQS